MDMENRPVFAEGEGEGEGVGGTRSVALVDANDST